MMRDQMEALTTGVLRIHAIDARRTGHSPRSVGRIRIITDLLTETKVVDDDSCAGEREALSCLFPYKTGM